MTPIVISGDVRLQDAPGLMQRIEEALGEGDVALDAAGLQGADAFLIQLLVSAQQTAALLGRTIALPVERAGPLPAAFAALGLPAGPDDLLAGTAAR